MGEVCSACAANPNDEIEQPLESKAYGQAYKNNVMFLCNHNSCRSQMAEGWLRYLSNGKVGIASAGIECGTAIREGAISVMKEKGVDISVQTSDSISDYNPQEFNIVISCCGCAKKLDTDDKKAWKGKDKSFSDWMLDDPPAIDPGDLSEYRRVRDECKAKVLELLAEIDESS